MNSTLRGYNGDLSALRKRLNQTVVNRSSDVSLKDRLTSKHADILHNAQKHMIHDPMLLQYPSRLKDIRSNINIAESSENNENEDKEEAESESEFNLLIAGL